MSMRLGSLGNITASPWSTRPCIPGGRWCEAGCSSGPVLPRIVDDRVESRSAGDDVVVLVADAEDTAGDLFVSAHGADRIGAVVPESEERSARIAAGVVAVMLQFLSVAIFVIVDDVDASLPAW